MKPAARLFFCLFILPAAILPATAQISESVPTVSFGLFQISSSHKQVKDHYWLYVHIYKGEQLMLTDSVVTDVKACQGFSFPDQQPFRNYYIFSRHTAKTGLTYILTKTGGLTVVSGGTFWAAPKHQLLFVLAEKDYHNLLVFSLAEMKTIFEKYSCDEFTGWYMRHNTYFGKVSTECGTELKTEKEVSEWMHPVEIEQFDVKRRTLNEMHLTDLEVEHSHPLKQYAGCR